MTGESHSRQWRRIGLAVAIVWVLFFAYLLFADDPPDFFWDDIAEVDALAHFVGGATTGVIAFLLLSARPRAFAVALVATASVLVGLEVLQDVFTSRRWENSDVGLALLGGGVGVLVAAALARVVRRSR
jgi:hypothetical protein